MDKIRIAVISPYQQFAEDAKNAGQHFSEVVIDTYVGYFDEGIEYAKEMEKKGCDAIISRGITAEEIKKITNIPVFKANESLYDLIKCLHQARKIGKEITILVHYKNVIIENQHFHNIINEIFDTNLNMEKYESAEDHEKKFIEMKDKCEVIIGGAFAMDLCKKYSKPGVLLTTGRETQYFTIREAIRVIKMKRKESFKAKQLKTILDYTTEGIISVDDQARITLINPIAEKMLHIDFDNAIGKHVTEVVPNTKLHEIVKTGISQLEEVQQIRKDLNIVTNRVPIIIDGKIKGAVATFKDVTQLQQVEKKVRLQLHQKGCIAKYTLNDIIGDSDKIRECKILVKRFGKFDSSVLLYGETGTGKELFAQSIHNVSKRKNAPFYAINCAALPEDLLESELFGYSEGSFTGAKKGGKAGLFELANGGTVYLDEISEMPFSFQSKLLRVLQEKEIRRIGDEKIIPVDVRIIAATNKNLFNEVLEKRFREDLFYRISVLNLNIPPLRERKEDIWLLIQYFMKVYNKKFRTHIELKFSNDIIEFLKQYEWRGNVRELQNFVERILVYGYDGSRVELADIAKLLNLEKTYIDKKAKQDFSIYNSNSLEDIIDKTIKQTLIQCNGNQTEAAKRLGVSRSFIWRRLKKMQGEENYHN